jgi:hypothetical protein
MDKKRKAEQVAVAAAAGWASMLDLSVPRDGLSLRRPLGSRKKKENPLTTRSMQPETAKEAVG